MITTAIGHPDPGRVRRFEFTVTLEDDSLEHETAETVALRMTALARHIRMFEEKGWKLYEHARVSASGH